MARSKRIRCAVSKLSKSGILGIGIAGLVLLVGSRPAGGGPPNPTPSDAHGNTAGGAFALLNNTTGLYNTAFGQGTLYGNTADNYNTALGLNALISTIQQQQQQIDEERQQIAALKAENERSYPYRPRPTSFVLWSASPRPATTKVPSGGPVVVPRMTGIGASRPLPRVPARVPLLKR